MNKIKAFTICNAVPLQYFCQNFYYTGIVSFAAWSPWFVCSNCWLKSMALKPFLRLSPWSISEDFFPIGYKDLLENELWKINSP